MTLREELATQLEAGASYTMDGKPFLDFERLFLDTSKGALVRFYFDVARKALLVGPLGLESRGMEPVPFDFRTDWSDKGGAARCARSQMLLGAAMIREGMMPTVEEWLGRHGESSELGAQHGR